MQCWVKMKWFGFKGQSFLSYGLAMRFLRRSRVFLSIQTFNNGVSLFLVGVRGGRCDFQGGFRLVWHIEF